MSDAVDDARSEDPIRVNLVAIDRATRQLWKLEHAAMAFAARLRVLRIGRAMDRLIHAARGREVGVTINDRSRVGVRIGAGEMYYVNQPNTVEALEHAIGLAIHGDRRDAREP